MSLLWTILGKGITAGRRTAVVDDRRAYTYRELLGGAVFVADAIERATSARHVGILLPTSGGFALALLGAWLTRRVAVPYNFLLSPDELRYIIEDSDADTIITVDALLEHIDADAAIPPGVKLIKLDKLNFSGFPPLRWPPRPPKSEPAAVLYTSGTSGRPKGVVLSHGNLQANVDGARKHLNLRPDVVFVGVLPQFHSFGLTGLTLLPLAWGCKAVYSARFVPRKVIDLIKEHQADVFLGVPSMFNAMLGVKKADAADLASLQYPVSGGEPLSDETIRRFKERFDKPILQGYGLTETAPVVAWAKPEENRPGSVGRIFPDVEVIVIDDHGKVLPPGAEGELLIHGPNVMLGYYKLPELTDEVFVDVDVPGPGGAVRRLRCFRTGDVGKVDQERFLYITGRIKEMLIISGENVFPREIEDVLDRHESVAASAVVGIPDASRGEAPAAFVEARDGAAVDENELKQWVRKHLAPFKTPRSIVVVDELPRSPTGKVLRRKLRENPTMMHEAEGESAA